jgi:methylthioribulose-1-phosphate dehydratase
MNYYDELIVPIIENTPREEDLQEWMAKAMEEYPNANAVLVRFGFLKAHTFRIAYIVGRQYLANMKYDEFRRHGVYVWGPTWQKAKSMCECYDYLFEIAVKMKQLGIDPSVVPETSIYKHLVKSTK